MCNFNCFYIAFLACQYCLRWNNLPSLKMQKHPERYFDGYVCLQDWPVALLNTYIENFHSQIGTINKLISRCPDYQKRRPRSPVGILISSITI